MTKKEYDKIQFDPDHIKAVNIGKAAIDTFINSASDRVQIEYGMSLDDDPELRILLLTFFFYKYLFNKYTDTTIPSAVICYVLSRDREYLTHNLLDGWQDNPKLLKQITAAVKKIKRQRPKSSAE